MTQPSPTTVPAPPRTLGAGYLFGVPLGNLGWFGSLLISVASGFLAFFASTFLAIVVLLIVNTTSHANIDFALSYRRIGFPIGVTVLIVASAYLGTLWFKRILRRS